jgi:hypothetical protein
MSRSGSFPDIRALNPAARAWRGSYAASGTARARASAQASLARIVRSACSRTRSRPRTRSGSSAHSCFNRPNSRSTAPRERYSLRERSDSRGTSGCRRSALIQRDFGWHSPVGQRHLVARRLKSAPANVHVPCSHVGAWWSPRLTAGVSRSGVTGQRPGPCSRRGTGRCHSPCRQSPRPPQTRARVPHQSAEARSSSQRHGLSRRST